MQSLMFLQLRLKCRLDSADRCPECRSSVRTTSCSSWVLALDLFVVLMTWVAGCRKSPGR